MSQVCSSPVLFLEDDEDVIEVVSVMDDTGDAEFWSRLLKSEPDKYGDSKNRLLPMIPVKRFEKQFDVNIEVIDLTSE